MNGSRVLIVDDDPALLQALPAALALRMEGLQVDTSDSAPAALEHVAETDYDAIVSDIKMPGMDGIALMREIRALRPTTPTLLITGHGEHELTIEALRGGAYDFIQKPIDRDYFVASLTRAIEMRRLEREIEEQRRALERHARVLEQVGDGVFLVDADGVVRLWTRAAEAITGLAAEAMIGARVEEALPGWAAAAPLVPVADAPGLPGRAPQTVPLRIGARELWLSIAGVETADGTIYAFRDVTDERAIDEIKAEFVATVSHELRTPLAAVYGAAQTLHRRDLVLDELSRERLLAIISDESERLAKIVNDILLASRLDAGLLPLAREGFDPVELAESVAEAIATHAPAGIRISVSAPESVPKLAGDPSRLRQVLVNLVENAVKYSPDGGLVEVSIEPRAGYVRFGVRDEGLGIPLGEQQRIFMKFYRLDPNLTRGVGGTGLGLYISNELVRRMNGRIWVASKEGEGSTFFVELPLPPGRADGVEERAASNA